MQTTNETPKTEITIQGGTFTVPQPFVEGHVMTANEAAALNQVLAENLRNNFAAKVKAAKDEVDGAVDQLDIESLQKELDDYIIGYEFGVRRAGTRTPMDPVERESMKLARKKVNTAIKRKGLKKEDVGVEKYNTLVEELAKRPEIVAIATQTVELAKASADIEIEA